MNITVIGTGNMGSAFVKQLSAAGHTIRVTGNNLVEAQNLAAAHPGTMATVPSEALGNSQVIIVATAYADAISALHALGPLDGRIVIDITNPVTPDYMGLTVGFDTSAAEQIAEAFPEMFVVKAFNTVFSQVLAEGSEFPDGQAVPVFYAGDDNVAKITVCELIKSIGFKPVDAGMLKNSRYLEPLAGLNIYFAYGAGQGTQIYPAWISRGL